MNIYRQGREEESAMGQESFLSRKSNKVRVFNGGFSAFSHCGKVREDEEQEQPLADAIPGRLSSNQSSFRKV